MKRCVLGVLVALLVASPAWAGIAPKEQWWTRADLKVYMRILPTKVGIRWRGNYWRVTSWKCDPVGQPYNNRWPTFNCTLRLHDLNLRTLDFETHVVEAKFTVADRNRGAWTNIHEV